LGRFGLLIEENRGQRALFAFGYLVTKRGSTETSKADEVAFTRPRANLDPCRIEDALEAMGSATLRHRRLPAEQVVWLML
jgi:hypothetical protein